MKTQNISIIGLGRTGASVALALKEGPLDFTITGHDSDPELVKQALESGAIDKGENVLVRAASSADILVLTMPSFELEITLRAMGGDLQEHTLLIDMTASKDRGIKLAERYVTSGHYIGARPIFSASTFTDGVARATDARPDLFSNSVFCIAPGPETDPQAVETTVNFGRLLGAAPYFVDPLEYDSLAQGVESLPGLTAAAIFAAIYKTVGWRDILRFADLPFATATAPLAGGARELAYLALNDKQATLRWLDALMSQLGDVRRFVAEGNSELLTAVLDEMESGRAKWLEERGKNDWFEIKEPNVEIPGLSQRFLGNLGNLGSSR